MATDAAENKGVQRRLSIGFGFGVQPDLVSCDVQKFGMFPDNGEENREEHEKTWRIILKMKRGQVCTR